MHFPFNIILRSLKPSTLHISIHIVRTCARRMVDDRDSRVPYTCSMRMQQAAKASALLSSVSLLFAVCSNAGAGATGAAGSLSFSGPDPTAAVFTLEVRSSFAGVLQYDYFENASTVRTGSGSDDWLSLVPCATSAIAAAPSQLWPWPISNSSAGAPLLAAGGDCLDCRSDASHHCQPGDDIQLYKCLGTANQKWRREACSAAGTFLIVSEMSAACLGATPSGSAAMTQCSCSKNAWTAVPGKAAGTAQLKTVQHAPALCLAGNSSGGASTAFPAGYVQASPTGQGWAGSMWPRDGGAFLRELIMFGNFPTAVVHVRCLLSLLTTNEQGFFALPEHFEGRTPSGTLTAEEGTAMLVMNIVMLWQRLCHGERSAHGAFCEQLEDFLGNGNSPLAFWHSLLDGDDRGVGLVPGSGEFGGGCCAVPGIDSYLYYNSVQNSAVANGLRAAAMFEAARGNSSAATRHTATAALLRKNLGRRLTNQSDGSWIWAVNTTTLKPDSLLLTNPANIGFAGINELFAGTLTISAAADSHLARPYIPSGLKAVHLSFF